VKPDAAWEGHKGEPLAFLLQVNLAEVAPFDREGVLPPSGLLHFFFLDAIARFDLFPSGGEIIRVLYTPPGGARLRRLAPPDGLPPQEVYRGFALSPHVEWTIPPWGDLEVSLEQPDVDAGIDHWDELRDEAAEVQGFGPWYRPKHRMLGYPDFIQSGECGPEPTRWLLQVDSDSRLDEEGYPRPGMMWGDAGRIYYGIEPGDLAARRFDSVWPTMECH
jgi:uncharacterized protein YwqG